MDFISDYLKLYVAWYNKFSGRTIGFLLTIIYDLTFYNGFNVYFTFGAFLSTFIFLNFNRHDGMRCHVEFHCSRKYQKIHNIERSSLMAPNIEFYYLFFLYLSSLSLTHMTWANSCKRFIFRLKSIIFSFWHLWGIKLYLYLFYWNSCWTKKVFYLY